VVLDISHSTAPCARFDALDQTFALLKAHVVSIAPSIGENFVLQDRYKKSTYFTNVGLENHEQTEQITAKT